MIYVMFHWPVALPLPPSPVPIIDKPSKNDMKPKAAVNKVQNFDNEQEYQDIELTSMRRTIAKRLTQSKVKWMMFIY